MPRNPWKLLFFVYLAAFAVWQLLPGRPTRAPAPVTNATAASSPAPAEQLDNVLTWDFEHGDCGGYFLADRALEALASPAVVAYLVALMQKDDRLPFVGGCGDTYYPGAPEFYGHGTLVPYDLDGLAGRAAYLLDRLTFDRFDLATGLHDFPDAATRARQAGQVAAWWKARAGRFDRFEELVAALDDFAHPRRQELALREADRHLPGVNAASIAGVLLPRVRVLRRVGTHGVAEAAANFELRMRERP
jgi:hypothetical protein